MSIKERSGFKNESTYLTDKGVLSAIKRPNTIFKKHRDRLASIRDPTTRINNRILEATPKVYSAEI